jgi:hypothetical protein
MHTDHSMLPVGVHVNNSMNMLAGDAAERLPLEAMCHNCLAEVLKEQGSLEEAEAQARQGLALREKVGPLLLAWFSLVPGSACWV